MSLPDDTPRIPGRVFVPPFLISIALGMVATGMLLVKLKPARDLAYGKTFPLQAKLTAQCREPHSDYPFDLHELAHCTTGGQLELGAKDPGTSAKSVVWVIVGDGADDLATGQFQPGETSIASLAKLPVGTYVLTYLVEDRTADLAELRAAIAAAPGHEIPDQLVAIAQFATVQRHNGADVRTERIEFHVDKGAATQ